MSSRFVPGTSALCRIVRLIGDTGGVAPPAGCCAKATPAVPMTASAQNIVTSLSMIYSSLRLRRVKLGRAMMPRSMAHRKAERRR